MEKTMVIRCGGNSEMANGIASVFESPKLKKLEMEMSMSKHARSKEYERKIAQAKRKYAVKPIGKLHSRILGAVGLMVLVAKGEV